MSDVEEFIPADQKEAVRYYRKCLILSLAFIYLLIILKHFFITPTYSIFIPFIAELVMLCMFETVFYIRSRHKQPFGFHSSDLGLRLFDVDIRWSDIKNIQKVEILGDEYIKLTKSNKYMFHLIRTKNYKRLFSVHSGKRCSPTNLII